MLFSLHAWTWIEERVRNGIWFRQRTVELRTFEASGVISLLLFSHSLNPGIWCRRDGETDTILSIPPRRTVYKNYRPGPFLDLLHQLSHRPVNRLHACFSPQLWSHKGQSIVFLATALELSSLVNWVLWWLNSLRRSVLLLFAQIDYIALTLFIC